MTAADPLGELGRERVLRSCSADGPDGSAWCPSVMGKEAYTARRGRRVVECLLGHLQEQYGEVPARVESVTGPVYAADISRPGHAFILPVGRSPGERRAATEEAFLREVVETIRLLPDHESMPQQIVHPISPASVSGSPGPSP